MRTETEAFLFATLREHEAEFDVALRAFFRRQGLEHVLHEAIYPALSSGSGQLTIAVRRRPWPPWGYGALTVSAATLTHPIANGCAGLGNVFMAPEEASSYYLAVAVWAESLRRLAEAGVERVDVLALADTPVIGLLLEPLGFAATSHPVLTEQAVYWHHEVSLKDHLHATRLHGITPSDLVDGHPSRETVDRALQFILGINAVVNPWWLGQVLVPGVLPNSGPGRVAECLPPGGPPKENQFE